MIGVQVRHEDRIDAVRIDAELPHGDEAGRAAVDQKCGARSFHEEARVEPAAAAECIAAAEEPQLHQRRPWSTCRAAVARSMVANACAGAVEGASCGRTTTR